MTSVILFLCLFVTTLILLYILNASFPLSNFISYYFLFDNPMNLSLSFWVANFFFFFLSSSPNFVGSSTAYYFAGVWQKLKNDHKLNQPNSQKPPTNIQLGDLQVAFLLVLCLSSACWISSSRRFSTSYLFSFRVAWIIWYFLGIVLIRQNKRIWSDGTSAPE